MRTRRDALGNMGRRLYAHVRVPGFPQFSVTFTKMRFAFYQASRSLAAWAKPEFLTHDTFLCVKRLAIRANSRNAPTHWSGHMQGTVGRVCCGPSLR